LQLTAEIEEASGQAKKLNAERSDLETRCDGLDKVLFRGNTFTGGNPGANGWFLK
jgi:hypothetical protein